MKRAGAMDRLVTLYRRQPGQDDDTGQAQPVWVEVGKVWGSWNPLRGSRRWEAMQHVERAAGYFEIRYRPGLGPLHEVECEGVRYKIEGVPEEIGRREGLRLHVSARVEDES